MSNIYTCRFMQTAQITNPGTSANDIQEQYEEFRTILSDFLFGSDTFFTIDTVLKDVLFVLSNASKGKKKC